MLLIPSSNIQFQILQTNITYTRELLSIVCQNQAWVYIYFTPEYTCSARFVHYIAVRISPDLVRTHKSRARPKCIISFASSKQAYATALWQRHFYCLHPLGISKLSNRGREKLVPCTCFKFTPYPKCRTFLSPLTSPFLYILYFLFFFLSSETAPLPPTGDLHGKLGGALKLRLVLLLLCSLFSPFLLSRYAMPR